MVNTPIFLNLAFGGPYIEQQIRCNASIRNVYPDAHIKSWTNEYPPGSKTHRESLYGFKPHAVQWALDQGYSKIVWMDTAVIVNKSIIRIWTLTPRHPVLAAKDDNKLSGFICDKMLDWFGCDMDTVKNFHLIGGSVLIFDFQYQATRTIFNLWQFCEASGIFGSQFEAASGLINRSRHDESALAMSLYLNYSEPVTCDELGYNVGDKGEFLKKHFK